jgi:hypothetical protein
MNQWQEGPHTPLSCPLTCTGGTNVLVGNESWNLSLRRGLFVVSRDLVPFLSEHIWFCLSSLEAVRRNSWTFEGKMSNALNIFIKPVHI